MNQRPPAPKAGEAWVASPAVAFVDNVVVDPSTGELAEVYGRENFEALNPGDSAFAGNVIDIGGTAENRDYLVNNDNPDLKGNHLDGDSTGEGGWSGFDINQSEYQTDTVYLQGVFDDHGNNFSPGVLNSQGNTQFLIRFQTNGWELIGIQDSAHSGPDIFDPSLPTVVTNVATLDGGFLLDISTTVYQPDTGTSWAHTATNTIAGFGTPSWRIFHDRRAGQTGPDFDDLLRLRMRIPSFPSRRRSRCYVVVVC